MGKNKVRRGSAPQKGHVDRKESQRDVPTQGDRKKNSSRSRFYRRGERRQSVENRIQNAEMLETHITIGDKFKSSATGVTIQVVAVQKDLFNPYQRPGENVLTQEVHGTKKMLMSRKLIVRLVNTGKIKPMGQATPEHLSIIIDNNQLSWLVFHNVKDAFLKFLNQEI